MPASHYLLAATLLPLLGFVVLIFFGKRFGRLAGHFGALLLLGSFALSVAALVTWVANPEFNHSHYVEAVTYRWIPLPSDIAPITPPTPEDALIASTPAMPQPAPALAIGMLVDSLTIAMFLMVTLIAFLVHLFSIAYMARDPRYSRYFAYLGLFSAAMLGLVLSDSLVQLFACWELVGICSYLLIGFWFERRGPAMASFKAVIVNRIGDAAFLIGMGILLMHAGASALTFFDADGNSLLVQGVGNALGVNSSEFLYFTSAAGGGGFLGLHWLTWVGLCLFGGAIAKSAQFPLHVWLPDAMEGPTPISALIHAATMVAAGVYLVARIYPILTMDARLVIAVIGCVTLLMGALLALVQTDIKRLLAYSTISQLGYMMLFLGAGGYTAGLIHLFTHAFFKACLFLGAGTVIHALGHEQRLEQMGGLWKKLPITAATFLLATLALIGTPFFAGFYSKELGLAVVYQYAHALAASYGHAHYAMLLFWIPLYTAFLTAYYMGRCWWLTFGGKPRNEELLEHAHEPALMTLPLIILALLSFSAWYDFFRTYTLIDRTLLPSAIALRGTQADLLAPVRSHVGPLFLMLPCLAALPAILVYFSGFSVEKRLSRIPGLNLPYLWLREKMFFDALYNGIVVNAFLLLVRIAGLIDLYLIDALVLIAAGLTRLLSRLTNLFETGVIDAAVNGTADLASWTGRAALAPQSGRIRVYVLAMVGGIVLIAGMLCLLLLSH